MKTSLPFKLISIGLLGLIIFPSCSRHNYGDSYFWQQAIHHKVIAIVPAEMVFVGSVPKNVTPEAIADIEERESIAFEQSLYNGVLRFAHTRDYMLSVYVQDISTTKKLLADNHITIRDSWRQDDKDLAKILGVDAIVRMRIQKKRYMSDLASYGVGVGRAVLSQIGSNNGFFVPYIPNKTNDISASCNVVSNNITLWNDYYKGTSDWNRPSEQIIDDITYLFGRHFPYRRRI